MLTEKVSVVEKEHQEFLTTRDKQSIKVSSMVYIMLTFDNIYGNFIKTKYNMIVMIICHFSVSIIFEIRLKFQSQVLTDNVSVVEKEHQESLTIREKESLKVSSMIDIMLTFDNIY